MKNFSYYFYVDYFKDIDYFNLASKKNEEKLKRKSNDLLNFKITSTPKKLGNTSFVLKLLPPGAIFGIGYLHDIDIKGGFKLGLSLDYTTGVPYIPGSSIKGVVRDFFDGEKLLKEKKEWIKLIVDVDFYELKKELIEEDIFFDAFVVANNEKIFDEDYITPHKEITKNPIPIKFLKIKAYTKFRFCFEFKKHKNEKEKLIKEILKRGVGAKTSFGFGRFE